MAQVVYHEIDNSAQALAWIVIGNIQNYMHLNCFKVLQTKMWKTYPFSYKKKHAVSTVQILGFLQKKKIFFQAMLITAVKAYENENLPRELKFG